MREIGVAVVGYGGMGFHHCNYVTQVEGLRLKAICDTDPVRRADAEKKHGVKTYTLLEEVIDDPGVELVVLVTPHHIHAQQAIQVLSAGRHVVVEKVMCLNVKEADAMIKAARASGRTLTVHHNRRFDSDFLTARQIMQSGVLGEIYQIECACNYWGPQSGWRTKKEYGGGYLYDAGGHMIDQIVQLAGCRAKTVFANLQCRVWTDTMDTETYANVIVRFESGLTGIIDISGIAGYRKPRFLIMGEKGTFVGIADEDFGKLSSSFIQTNVSDIGSRSEVTPLERKDALLYYRQLAEHLLMGAELQVKPEEAREYIKIIEGAFHSAETSRSVDVLNW